MFRSPSIILGGNAGSGKDTVGSYLAQKYNAACVAQADPMKRFAAEIFSFSEDQLWGPSSSRNTPDPQTVDDRLAINHRFHTYLLRVGNSELFGEVVPKTVNLQAAVRRLEHWFERIYQSLEIEIPASPRLVLQTLGTEWGRLTSQNMWNDYAATTCLKLLAGGFEYERTKGLIKSETQQGYDFGVITDGRFRNEIILTTMKGGAALRMDRINPDKAAVEAGGVKNHASERELDGIPAHFWTAILDNSGTLDELYQVVDHIMKVLYPNLRIRAANIQPVDFVGASQ